MNTSTYALTAFSSVRGFAATLQIMDQHYHSIGYKTNKQTNGQRTAEYTYSSGRCCLQVTSHRRLWLTPRPRNSRFPPGESSASRTAALLTKIQLTYIPQSNQNTRSTFLLIKESMLTYTNLKINRKPVWNMDHL